MHNTHPSPIQVDLGLSLWLAGYLLITHLLAVVLVFLLELKLYFSLGIIALIFFSLIYNWRRYLQLMLPNAVVGVDWSFEKGWLLRLKNGNNLKAALSPTSIVSRWLVILHFKTDRGETHRVAMAGDAVESNRLRKLKVLLKMHNHFGV